METIIMKGWPKYFQSIQDVCPWSYEAYKQGKLDIRDFDIDAIIHTDVDWTGEWNAVIWQHCPYPVDDMEKVVDDLNSESKKCIYFFSHPTYTKGRNKQTLVPVIIQQDKKQLADARQQKKGRNKP